MIYYAHIIKTDIFKVSVTTGERVEYKDEMSGMLAAFRNEYTLAETQEKIKTLSAKKKSILEDLIWKEAEELGIMGNFVVYFFKK